MIWTHPQLKVKNWKGERCAYKQYKYNGHRFRIFKQFDGTMIAFERTIRPDREITLLRPHIKDYGWWKCLELCMPKHSSIDGEIYVLRGNAGDAAHALAEGLGTLQYMPFAVPWWAGKDLSELDVLSARDILMHSTDRFISFAPTFKLLVTDNEEQLLRDAIDLDIEGWVLKHCNYKWWYKVKPTKEIDCIVTGFTDGDGKFIGLVGSLKVSAFINGELRELAFAGGFDDNTRIEINEVNDLGRVCEIEYQSIGNGGRLIHPRFIRWRDDKPADDCQYASENL